MSGAMTSGKRPYGARPSDCPAILFGAVDGDRIVHYGDDAAADGGWGAASNSNQITPFDIYVYDPAYSVPDWAKNATIYQIFPDRFRNGDETNDPTAADWFYPAERGHAWPIAPWNTIVPDPEPNVPENPWHMTYSTVLRRRPPGRARQAGLPQASASPPSTSTPSSTRRPTTGMTAATTAQLRRAWATWPCSTCWTRKPKRAA